MEKKMMLLRSLLIATLLTVWLVGCEKEKQATTTTEVNHEEKQVETAKPSKESEEVKKYPNDAKYYTELKYRGDLEEKAIEFMLIHRNNNDEDNEFYFLRLP